MIDHENMYIYGKTAMTSSVPNTETIVRALKMKIRSRNKLSEYPPNEEASRRTPMDVAIQEEIWTRHAC